MTAMAINIFLFTLLTAFRRHPGDLDRALALTARDIEHSLQVGLGVRLVLLLQPTLFCLLVALGDAVLHVDGVQHVVVLLEHAGDVHIGHVLQHGLRQRHRQNARTLLLPRCSAHIDGCLDGSGVAIPKTVLCKRNLDEVEQLVLVACLLDDGIVLRRRDHLVAVHDAPHDHRYVDGRGRGLILRVVPLEEEHAAGAQQQARGEREDDALAQRERLAVQ